MRIKYGLLIMLCFLFVMGNAQRNDNFMSIAMGASIPMSDFASTSAENRDAGYATTSFALGFDGAYLFTKNFGLGGAVLLSNNSVARTQLRDNLLTRIEEDYPDFELPEESQISFEVGAWNTINLMVGPYLSLPANQMTLDVRALAGASFVLPPEFQVNLSTPEQDLRRYSDIKRTVNFGYLIGGGFRFNTRANYIIRLSVDYTNTKASVKVTDQITKNNQTEENPIRTLKQPISALIIGVGIGYHF